MTFRRAQNITPYIVSLHGFQWLVFNSEQYQSFQIVGRDKLVNAFYHTVLNLELKFYGIVKKAVLSYDNTYWKLVLLKLRPSLPVLLFRTFPKAWN